MATERSLGQILHNAMLICCVMLENIVYSSKPSQQCSQGDFQQSPSQMAENPPFIIVCTTMLEFLDCLASKLGNQFISYFKSLVIDDGTSTYILTARKPYLSHFNECIARSNPSIKPIKRHAEAVQSGTLRWYPEDDAGLVHA